MNSAKPHADPRLYTVERDAMLRFWQQEVGLVYREMLPVGAACSSTGTA